MFSGKTAGRATAWPLAPGQRAALLAATRFLTACKLPEDPTARRGVNRTSAPPAKDNQPPARVTLNGVSGRFGLRGCWGCSAVAPLQGCPTNPDTGKPAIRRIRRIRRAGKLLQRRGKASGRVQRRRRLAIRGGTLSGQYHWDVGRFPPRSRGRPFPAAARRSENTFGVWRFQGRRGELEYSDGIATSPDPPPQVAWQPPRRLEIPGERVAKNLGNYLATVRVGE
jgi:hypothetical protein